LAEATGKTEENGKTEETDRPEKAGRAEETDKRRGRVKTVSRAIRILEYLGNEGGTSVTELSRSLALPKSSTFEILATLESEGIVEKDFDRSIYRLGPRLFELGYRAQAELEIRRVAVPALKALNEELDETIHLTILDEMEVLYIDCMESTKRLRTYSVIGVRAPLTCTAVGKAILAHLETDQAEEILRVKGLPRFTENTHTTRETLFADLAQIRRMGYAIDNMEHEEGVRCVGAPIRDHTGRVFASLSVSGPSQRITPERIPRIAEKVILRADEISRRMGFRGRGRKD
jgi:DNA-binding IclR family transcriptional regulator